MSKILLLVFLSVFTLIIGLYKAAGSERNYLLNRLKTVVTSSIERKKDEEDELNKPFSERVLKPILNQLSQFTARLIPARSRKKLEQAIQEAGFPGNLKAHEFQALHYILIAILSLGCWFLAYKAQEEIFIQVLMLFLGGFLGNFLGKSYLSAKARARNLSMEKELPNMLDLLMVSVEAGLGFDSALHRIVEKSNGILSDEIRIVLHEIQMGKTRRDALTDLGKRTGVEDIQAFTGAMVQADQLGISIGKVLRTQAQQVRTKRRQKVEEAAMKAPIKMLFPLIFFIFPSIFIVLMGPAVIQIYKSLFGAR